MMLWGSEVGESNLLDSVQMGLVHLKIVVKCGGFGLMLGISKVSRVGSIDCIKRGFVVHEILK